MMTKQFTVIDLLVAKEANRTAKCHRLFEKSTLRLFKNTKSQQPVLRKFSLQSFAWLGSCIPC
jgi:hypothetical protein